MTVDFWNKEKRNLANHKDFLVFVLLTCLLCTVFSLVLLRLYQRVGVFGCSDECINYTAGYFMLLGKSLYGQIFFNHQPILAFLSACIQWITQPQDLYHLVLYHRLFMVVYSFGIGTILVARFRLRALLFLLLYEGTKYYMYGYQFIGEAFIVYPLAYLLGLLWESFESKKFSRADIYFISVFTSIVLWAREPYIPVAVLIGGILFWRGRNHPAMKKAILLFSFLMLFPFFFFPFGQYIDQVIVANISAASAGGANALLRSVSVSLLYPLLIFTQGTLSYVRVIEIGIATFFWVGLVVWYKANKTNALLGIIFVILALAGVRVERPGTMYFEAFHMLPWYALFIMMTVLLVTSIRERKIQFLLMSAIVLFSCLAFISPRSFIWETVNTQQEFASQYAKYTLYSEAIRIVSRPSQTLFLDAWDDIIYWESKRDSSFPLSLYIPTESSIPKYQQMRQTMFIKSPPDMYYSCPELETENNRLPIELKKTYMQLKNAGKPSCLYLKTEMMLAITTEQRDRLMKLGFTMP